MMEYAHNNAAVNDDAIISHVLRGSLPKTCQVVGCQLEFKDPFPLCKDHYRLISMGFNFDVAPLTDPLENIDYG